MNLPDHHHLGEGDLAPLDAALPQGVDHHVDDRRRQDGGHHLDGGVQGVGLHHLAEGTVLLVGVALHPEDAVHLLGTVVHLLVDAAACHLGEGGALHQIDVV